jgi:hypothetical protein
MSAVPQILWTQEDALVRRCRFIDVGTPRIEEAPEPDTQVEPPPLPNLTDDELEAIPIRIIKRDAMRAYQRLGGANWLAQNPVLLQKVLLRLMPTEVNLDEKKDVKITITWAGPERLSYRKADVIEAQPTEWKEPTPEAGVAAVLRDEASKP